MKQSHTEDKQLRGITLEAVMEKRRLDQALNAKEFAVCAGVSYSTALAGFTLLASRRFMALFSGRISSSGAPAKKGLPISPKLSRTITASLPLLPLVFLPVLHRFCLKRPARLNRLFSNAQIFTHCIFQITKNLRAVRMDFIIYGTGFFKATAKFNYFRRPYQFYSVEPVSQIRTRFVILFYIGFVNTI